MDSPLIQVFLILLVGYLLSLWLFDLKNSKSDNPNPKAFPGATSSPILICVLGVIGSLLILGLEVMGESHLEVSEEQSTMTALFALVAFASAFGEELIFRGFLFFPKKGKLFMWGGILGFSLLFSLLHPFLWESEGMTFTFNFSAKGWLSTSIVFLNSIWFYFLRATSLNPKMSLTPCILAHLCSNIGVFVIKLGQGFVSGWY